MIIQRLVQALARRISATGIAQSSRRNALGFKHYILSLKVGSRAKRRKHDDVGNNRAVMPMSLDGAMHAVNAWCTCLLFD